MHSSIFSIPNISSEMRLLKQARTPVLSAWTFWTILLFFSTFFTTTSATRILHTNSLFIYDPQWQVVSSDLSTGPTTMYACLNGSLFLNYRGGNVTLYGVQPTENDQVTFEAWIDSGQVALFDAEPDTEVTDPNDTTSTNGVRALKTIVVDPSEHQLYLRITNPTDNFFFFAGVDVVPMDGSDNILPRIHGIDATIVDETIADPNSQSSSSASSSSSPISGIVAIGTATTTLTSPPTSTPLPSARFPTPTALIMPDSPYLTYGPMSSALPPLAYFMRDASVSSILDPQPTSSSGGVITRAASIDGGTPTAAIVRRQDQDSPTTPILTPSNNLDSTSTRGPSTSSTTSSTSTSSSTSTTSRESPNATSSPDPTSSTSRPTPTAGTSAYRGFNTSYSGWILANDLYLARYAALNGSISDTDFASYPTDYGARTVNRMNITNEDGSIENDAANRGTTVWSNTVGSNVKFSFFGTRLFLFAPSSYRSGSAAITIDNLPPVVVQLESNPTLDVPIVQRLVFESLLLDETYHDVGITVVSGEFVWDFIKIIGRTVGAASTGTDAPTGLGMGAKIALGICIPLLVGLILLGVWFWIRRRRQNVLAGEHKQGLGQKSKIFANLRNLPSLPLHLPHRQPKPPVPYPTSPDTSEVLSTDSSDTYVLLPKYSTGPHAQGRYHDQKSHNHNLGSTPSPNSSSNRNAAHGVYAVLGRSGSSSGSHYSDDSHERHGHHQQHAHDRSSSYVSGVSSVDPPFSYTQGSDFRDLTTSPVPSSVVHAQPQPHQHQRQRSSLGPNANMIGGNNPFNPSNPSNPFITRNGRGRLPSGSSRVWSPPPPSYLTLGSNAGHGALATLRNGGNGSNGTNSTGMMALSHEALARLVDRVAALRAMSEKELRELRDIGGSQRDGESNRRETISSSDGPDGTDGTGVWSEDDEVEALARQIAAIDRRI